MSSIPGSEAYTAELERTVYEGIQDILDGGFRSEEDYLRQFKALHQGDSTDREQCKKRRALILAQEDNRLPAEVFTEPNQAISKALKEANQADQALQRSKQKLTEFLDTTQEARQKNYMNRKFDLLAWGAILLIAFLFAAFFIKLSLPQSHQQPGYPLRIDT